MIHEMIWLLLSYLSLWIIPFEGEGEEGQGVEMILDPGSNDPNSLELFTCQTKLSEVLINNCSCFFPFIQKVLQGLANFGVHMTANWIWFWKATKTPLNSQNVKKKIGLLLTHRDKILHKTNMHVTHNTSHITNCMGICLFYKIFRIKVVMHFGNSLKLNLN